MNCNFILRDDLQPINIIKSSDDVFIIDITGNIRLSQKMKMGVRVIH